jgi:hypothetical protein
MMGEDEGRLLLFSQFQIISGDGQWLKVQSTHSRSVAIIQGQVAECSKPKGIVRQARRF